MEFTHEHHLNGYVFHISAVLTSENRYQGKILVSRRGDTGASIEPALTVDTPGTFKSFRAAQIEASAYAHELIYSGEILSIMETGLPAQSVTRCHNPTKNKQHSLKRYRSSKNIKKPVYYVSLSTLGKFTFRWFTTKTSDCDTALAAFHELSSYRFLNGKPYQVILKHNNILRMRHRFDNFPESEEKLANPIENKSTELASSTLSDELQEVIGNSIWNK